MELQGNLWVKIRREAKGERLNWIGDWGWVMSDERREKHSDEVDVDTNQSINQQINKQQTETKENQAKQRLILKTPKGIN